jgi:hypothetical protein
MQPPGSITGIPVEDPPGDLFVADAYDFNP